jgi:hypothetical protein
VAVVPAWRWSLAESPWNAACILAGTLSALLVALFGSYNKRLVERADPSRVTCAELEPERFSRLMAVSG